MKLFLYLLPILILTSNSIYSSEDIEFTEYICHNNNTIIKNETIQSTFIGYGSNHHCDWDKYKEKIRVTVCKKINHECKYQCHSKIKIIEKDRNVSCL